MLFFGRILFFVLTSIVAYVYAWKKGVFPLGLSFTGRVPQLEQSDRIPPLRGVAQFGRAACFGSTKSQVRILSPRFFHPSPKLTTP